MICGNCQTENRSDRKFCLRCGAPLLPGCPNCGAVNEPEAVFCGECGTRLAGSAQNGPDGRPSLRTDQPPAPPSGATSTPEPASERRLVTVLFADLVGFTSVAEGLDAEDTRELLGRYFDRSRVIIERYGGTVEKFIGDAVMAVWGAPTAREDDAERAVRAALDLVAAVPELAGGLKARAGVLTGEAAVTLGATGQGMVAGDLVNTASRLQAAAPPGSVLVGERTYRAASDAIAFEPAGDQVLKGKEAPVAAWRAASVVGKVRGAGRSDVVEPPFVGRDAEFSALKERLHATGRDRRARLVSVTGVAGMGKSRLVWELEKYADGIVEVVYWHQGRSLAYGEGIAFWALGEMVRRRAGIAESDDSATTDEKLAAMVAEFAGDDEERRWVLSRLRGLLGLEDLAGTRRDELFAAWRRLFERIAERATVVLVFEDLQWADDGQIEFIDSLMEWSRPHPILIVTLARPELFERRPTWGAGQREFTAIHLEPLAPGPMTALVAGLGGDLPANVVETIVRRSEGVPLYAVELFRMQLDRGRLERDERGYRVVGGAELDVPETLQSLIAARLDALPAADRRLLQDAATLGQTFSPDALAAVSGQRVEEQEPVLRGLVRRELLYLDRDPRSPERGQYGFVGALVREVAYGTVARRDRRSRHLAAARYFEALGDDELAGVLASHYLSAHAASQPGAEADAVATQARIALRGAAERALAVASPEAAVTYLRQALAVTSQPNETARLHEDIARSSLRAAQWQIAGDETQAALEAYEALGDARGIARASSIRGNILFFQGRIEASVELLERALGGLDGSDTELALELHRQLGRAEMFRAQPGRALEWVESGLAAAARLDDVEAIGDLLITRAWAAATLGRSREAVAENRGALEFARAQGLIAVQLRAANNLGTFLLDENPAESIRILDEAMEIAERVGDRDSLQKLAFVALPKVGAGDWEGAMSLVDRWLRDDAPNLDYLPLASCRATMLAWSARAQEAAAQLRTMRERLETSESHQDRYALHITEVWLALAEGADDRAVEAATQHVAVDRALGGLGWEGTVHLGLLAARRGDRAALRDIVATMAALKPQLPPVVAARRVLEGALLAREGRAREAAAAYRDGIERYRRVGMLLHAAIAGLDAVEALGPGDPLVADIAEGIRHYVTRSGAVLLERRLAEALAPRADPAGAPTPAGQRTAAPQNVRTTS